MRKLFTILSIVFVVVNVRAQHGLSFYHLRNATFQSTSYNAAMFPEGKVFIGLPALSGVNFYVNNRFSYNQAINNLENGTNQVDIDNVVNELGLRNNTSTHTSISLLHLGFRLPSGAAVSLFANERVAADVLYPKEVAEWFWKGNAHFIGDKVNLTPLSASANYFREYGLGLAYKIPETPYNFGIRVKYLQGIANASTPSGFRGSVQSDNENYQLSLDWTKGELRTAGIDKLQNGDIGYLISNGNRGFGIDLGMEYRMNKYYTVALAVNDIGFIGWKEDIKNQRMADTSFVYNGIELKGVHNIFDAIDTLINSFEFVENTNTYTSMIPANVIGSFIYSPMKGTDVISTLNARIIHGQIKTGLGVGLTQNFGPKVIVSGSVTKLPQQFLNVGAGFAVTAGPVQLYASADKLFGYSVPNMKWAEMRVGMNFVFGSGTKSKKPGGNTGATNNDDLGPRTQSKGVQTGSFHGQDVKVKGYDGIYTIVKTPPKNPGGTITPEVNKNTPYGRGYSSATGAGHNFDKAPNTIKSNSSRSNKVGKKHRPFPGSSAPTHESRTRNASAGKHQHTQKSKTIRSSGPARHDSKSGGARSASGNVNHQKGKKKKPKKNKRKR